MSVAASKKRRRLQPEVRRDEILATATRLLAERGYNGVSVQEIADGCGMAKSGVLHHFPSKIALLIAVLEAKDVRDGAAAEPPPNGVLDPQTARARLDRLVESNFEQREMLHLFALLGGEALDPAHPAHDFFNRRLEYVLATLREACAAWHPDPDRVSRQIVAFMDGLQVLWLRDPSTPYMALWNDFADRIQAD